MENTCHSVAEQIRFQAKKTLHSIAFIFLTHNFHTKEPDGLEGAIDVLLLPNL